MTATFSQPKISAGGWQSADNAHGSVDLSRKEQGDYSICAAVNASLTNDWSGAGLERAASRDIARQLGRDPGPGGFFMPCNLRSPYAVGASGTGGALVQTSLLASSFIEALTNNISVLNAGATVLGGLIGNVAIPKRQTLSTGYWVAESGVIPESESTFANISLSPKVVGGYSRWSRLALQQTTPDIEMLARADLTGVLGRAIDLAAISGSGNTNQPTGILNTTSIGSVAIGTNGGAMTLETMIDLRTAVAAANVDAKSGAYLVNDKTYGALLKLKSSGSGEYLFADAGDVGPAGIEALKIAGNPVIVSNQLTSSGTKGSGTNLSTAIFGVFSDLIVGNWGVIELLVNPYGAGYTSGDVEIRAMQTVDVVTRYPQAFAACKDITT